MQIPEDVERLMEKKKAEQAAHNISIQPYIIAVGNNLREITYTLVIIDSMRYKFDGTLKALDILFKSFHVLKAEYTIECSHIWTLIQKGVYIKRPTTGLMITQRFRKM